MIAVNSTDKKFQVLIKKSKLKKETFTDLTHNFNTEEQILFNKHKEFLAKMSIFFLKATKVAT